MLNQRPQNISGSLGRLPVTGVDFMKARGRKRPCTVNQHYKQKNVDEGEQKQNCAPLLKTWAQNFPILSDAFANWPTFLDFNHFISCLVIKFFACSNWPAQIVVNKVETSTNWLLHIRDLRGAEFFLPEYRSHMSVYKDGRIFYMAKLLLLFPLHPIRKKMVHLRGFLWVWALVSFRKCKTRAYQQKLFCVTPVGNSQIYSSSTRQLN